LIDENQIGKFFSPSMQSC